jgi:outer membrane protein OmpA-like peptidoglycan-associated protein
MMAWEPVQRGCAALVLAFALGACAVQAPVVERPVPPVTDLPLEPEAVSWIEIPLEPEPVQWIDSPLPEPRKATRDDLVTVIPKADGSVGSVVVYQNGEAVVLDRAWASARIEGPGQVSAFTAEAVDVARWFGATREALPARPARFTLYFREGSDALTSESELAVARVIEELDGRPAPEISIIGHSDTMGTIEFNDRLSLQRAERVRDLLLQRGISPSSLSIAGRGKRELVIETPDNTSEPRNRRVEISVR